MGNSRPRPRPPSRAAACLAALSALACGAACGTGPGGRGATVVYASGADLQSINPLVTVHPLAKAVQQHVLLLTLAVYDSTGRVVPRLARWEWHDGRTALTFHLRPDVRWHDGRPTVAEDVAWTLRMARDPAVAYPRARELAAVAVETPDSLTVRMRFPRAQPTFPDVLTDLAILPAHRFHGVEPSAVRTAPFNRQPVGNGPFAFVEHRPNQRWVFARHPEFPEALGRPAIERLVVAVVDEATTKLAALTAQELDFAGINPAHAAFVRQDARLRVIEYPLLFSYAIVWNLRRPPFDDAAVRRALTLALDRRTLVDAFVYGFGVVADGPVPPDHSWYEPVATVPFDREEAGRLLDARGWLRGPDGVRRRGDARLAVELMTVGAADLALEQMIQAQLRELGVEVRLRQLELASFLARAQASERDFDALVTGIPGDRSLGYVAAMFGGRDPGPTAYPGYRSAPFDAALERAGRATTEAGLHAAWRDAQRVLARDHPTTWLYHARGVQGANRRVVAPAPDLRGELADIAAWRIREGPGDP